jgi:hypothetical protein
VEEKLLVNRYDKWPHEPNREKRTKKGWGQRFRSSADVGRLADVAGSFALSFCV